MQVTSLAALSLREPIAVVLNAAVSADQRQWIQLAAPPLRAATHSTSPFKQPVLDPAAVR